MDKKCDPQSIKLRGPRQKAQPNLDPPPLIKSKSDLEMPKVTPVRGPWLLDRGPLNADLGSGKVAGKVLIVDHM